MQLRLTRRALDDLGLEVDTNAGALDVGVLVIVIEEGGERLQETWLSFRMPPKADVPPYPEWLNAAIAALLPDAEAVDLEFGAPFPRPSGPIRNEIVVRVAQ